MLVGIPNLDNSQAVQINLPDYNFRRKECKVFRWIVVVYILIIVNVVQMNLPSYNIQKKGI